MEEKGGRNGKAKTEMMGGNGADAQEDRRLESNAKEQELSPLLWPIYFYF